MRLLWLATPLYAFRIRSTHPGLLEGKTQTSNAAFISITTSLHSTNESVSVIGCKHGVATCNGWHGSMSVFMASSKSLPSWLRALPRVKRLGVLSKAVDQRWFK
eukprot:5553386-Pleurochrysis_carterae.AAC.3